MTVSVDRLNQRMLNAHITLHYITLLSVPYVRYLLQFNKLCILDFQLVIIFQFEVCFSTGEQK